jgi:hypothetical protein
MNLKLSLSLLLVLGLVTALAGCFPAAAPVSQVVTSSVPTPAWLDPPDPTAGEAPTPTPEIFMPAPIEGVISDAARTDLSARLGIDFASISVTSLERQSWPDGCLGLAPAAVQTCEQGVVPGFRLVLNAAGHTHEYRAASDGKLILYSGPVGAYAPPACSLPGASPVYSPEDGYCFAYPVRFHRTDEGGPLNIYGPAKGAGPEPLYAALGLEVSRLVAGETLEAAVESFLVQLGDVPLPEQRENLQIDGEPALRLEVVPGMLGSRDVFVAHDGLLFHLTFWPAPEAAADTAGDVNDLYRTVIQTLHFGPFD